MTNKFLSLAAGAALLALAGTAYAEQPLSNKQMDGVTAGGIALANAASVAFGELLADTISQTSTNVSLVTPKGAVAQAFSQALATGGFLFNAAAISHVDTAASFP
jgi:hypothetical protein